MCVFPTNSWFKLLKVTEKIRNTFRFILGNLDQFDLDENYISYSMRSPIHKVMTMKLYNVYNDIIDAYEKYDFDKVYRNIMPFIINELSAFYLDFTKDILYIEKEDDYERRSVQSTYYDILILLLKVLTPIIPHTTEEVYQSLVQPHKESIYLTNLPSKIGLNHPDLLKTFDLFESLRVHVLKALETARNDKIIGKSLQASLDIHAPKNIIEAIKTLEINLKQVLMVAHIHMHEALEISVSVSQFEGHTCARCWNVFETLNEDELCDRCQNVVKG